VKEARAFLRQSGGFALSKVVEGKRTFAPFHQWSSFFTDVPTSEVRNSLSFLQFVPLNQTSAQRTLVFLDPSSQASSPSWLLRNVLSYLTHSHGVTVLRLLSLQETTSRTVSLRLKLDETIFTTPASERPGVVGWEKNEKGKLAPRMADLAPLMDPTRFVTPPFILPI